MEYKITVKNQFIALRMLIYNTIGIFVAAYYLYLIIGYNFDVESFCVIYYLALIIPAIYIHIQYYLENKNDVVAFDISKKTIRINNGNLISFDKIENITIIMSFIKFRRGGLKYLPSDNYQYAKFKFKEGQEYTLTSLMIPKLEEFIDTLGVAHIERKGRFVPNII